MSYPNPCFTLNTNSCSTLNSSICPTLTPNPCLTLNPNQCPTLNPNPYPTLNPNPCPTLNPIEDLHQTFKKSHEILYLFVPNFPPWCDEHQPSLNICILVFFNRLMRLFEFGLHFVGPMFSFCVWWKKKKCDFYISSTPSLTFWIRNEGS